MMKSIALLPRRSDTTRAVFHDYYERHHAPLALKHFPFTKYVRNHLAVDDAVDIGFDTISEFWCDDLAKLAAPMAGEIGVLMKADESRFMGKDVRSGSSEEHLLRGAPRRNDHGAHKTVLFFTRDPATSRDAFGDALKTWGAKVPADRVTLDLMTAWPGGALPCEAMVWLWSGKKIGLAIDPPAGANVWRTITVTAHETSPDLRPSDD